MVDVRVSVLMPVRNALGTVRTAARGLLEGMDERDELLLIDDGSTDGTSQLLADLASVDPRVRLIRTSGSGLVQALNLGLRESRFRWIARADADDRYPANRMAAQRAAIREGVVLISADYRVVSGPRSMGVIPSALTHPFVVTSLINPQRVPHPGVLFDRDAVLAAGGYRQHDFPAEDLALWLRLSRQGSFVGVPEVVVSWSMSASSISHSNQTTQREKTVELLSRDFPWEVLRSITSDQVETELASYAKTPFASERRLLLARDLERLTRNGLPSNATRVVRQAVIRHPVASLRSLASLASDAHRRRSLRARSFAI